MDETSQRKLAKAIEAGAEFNAWNALCMKHPRIAKTDFVAESYLDGPPYLKCRDVNGGACPLFEPKKETKE